MVEIYPDFRLSDPLATQSVTMGHLLSMRGGIPDNAEDNFAADSLAADMFNVVAQSPLLGTPLRLLAHSKPPCTTRSQKVRIWVVS